VDIRPSYKDKLQNARLVPLLPAWLPGVWVNVRVMCSWEVPMPTMQGSYEVHMVEEGWQVFVVRQTSSLDTEVIVRLGQGRKHGRLWIADGADSSSSAPSLSDVRAQSTS
jgi:hypothetical protein